MGKYSQNLENTIQLSGAEQLETLKSSGEAMVNENVSFMISQHLLTDSCTYLPNLPDGTAKEIFFIFTLEKIQPRVISFEKQVASIRQHLATTYEKEGCRKADHVLVGISLETVKNKKIQCGL